MADPLETPARAQRPLAPGTRVEVRRRYDQRWARGFEVAAVDDDSYLVRRISDRTVLPTRFARTDLRRERQPTWWF